MWKDILGHVKGGVMDESPFGEIAHPQQRAFLAAFQQTGNVRLACEVAKVGRSSHYRWLEEHPEYREAFELAKECAADVLEAAAYRRAVTGWDEPAGWYKGEAGRMVRKYSDVLLMFLLKGIRPEKYGDRMEVRGAFANLDISKLPDALVHRLSQGENPLSVLAGRRELLEPGDDK